MESACLYIIMIVFTLKAVCRIILYTCSFPTAFFMDRMEEVFSVTKKAELEENVYCDNCSKQPSVAFCQHCSEYFCTKCFEAHQTMRKFSSHKVVSIESLRSSISMGLSIDLPVVCKEVMCSKHKDEPLKLYCRDCHKLVCRDCTLIDHKDHSYAFVVDAAPKCKLEIKQNVESVKKLSDDLKSAVKSLNDSEKELSAHSTATTKAIDDALDKVASKLMQKRKELKQKARQVVDEVKEKIVIQEKNAQLAVGEVESLLEFMNRNLEIATDQEVLSLEKQISDQVHRVSQLYDNPGDKFPVPQIPELQVHCGGKVEQIIKDEITVASMSPTAVEFNESSSIADKFNESFDPPDTLAEERPKVFSNPNQAPVIQQHSMMAISQPQEFKEATDDAENTTQKPLESSAAKITTTASDVMMVTLSHDRTLTLKRGDISKEKADALVNAANGHLSHLLGVSDALNKASNGKLQEYSNDYMDTKRKGEEIPVGEVAVTHGGGNLQCSYVIHAVGPPSFKYSPSECEHYAKLAVQNTLRAAEMSNAKSIALPALGCGTFSVSKDLMACSIIDTIVDFEYSKPPPVLSDIRIVIYDEPTHSCFAPYFAQLEIPSHKSSVNDHRSEAVPSKTSKNFGRKEASIEGEVRYL